MAICYQESWLDFDIWPYVRQENCQQVDTKVQGSTGADNVHYFCKHLNHGKIQIYKQQSDIIPPLDGQTLPESRN